MSDGTLRFDTKIDTEGIDKGTKSVKGALKSFVNSLSAMGSDANKAFDISGATSEANVKIQELVGEIDRYRDSLYYLEKQGKYFGDKEYDQAYSKLSRLEGELNTYKKSLSSVDTAQKSVSKSANKTGKIIDSMSKSTNNGHMSMLKMLKMSLLFSVVFRALSAATQAVTEGFQNLAQFSKQTNKDISTLSTSGLTLKNSFATALAPILTAITPALQTLINYLAQAITTAGQFFAVFFNGATTFTKAKEAQVDYAASLKKTAKEAEKSLSPIDKLNMVSDSSGGGNDTPGVPKPSQMFENVPIDSKITNFVKDLKKQLEPLIKAFDRFKVAITPFAKNVGAGLKWFLDNVIIPLGKWTVTSLIPGFLDALGSGIGVLNSVIEVFKPYGLWLWDNFLEPIAKWTGGSIITGLKMLTDGLNSLSKWMMDNKELVATTVIAIGTFFAAFKVAEFLIAIAPLITALGGFITSGGILTAILSGLATVLAAITSPVAILAAMIALLVYGFVDLYNSSEKFRNSVADLGKTWGTALKPIADFVGTLFTDAWDKVLRPVIDFFVNTLFPQLMSTVETFWQRILVPLANFIGIVLQPVFKILGDILTQLWKNIVLPLANAVGATLKQAWDAIYSILNKTVMPIFSNLIALLTFLWKNLINPIIDVLWKNFKPAFDGVFKDIGDTINGLKGVLTGVLQFITGVLTGDWKKAWEGLKAIVKGVFDSLEAFANSPLRAILNMVYGFIYSIIDGVNTLINAINKINIKIPKTPFSDAYQIGFNLKTIDKPKVPALATGAVIPPNSQFLALLGDQKKGVNIEAPLDTIVEAFKKVGGNSNGENVMFHITLMLQSGKILLDTIVEAEKEVSNQTGKPAFQY
ncbi:phage tail protein [Anaerocolumna chitinilytica]|uniref:Uncharacterized protein n=1 Tax=Anaerocolumna chitinilytica TaxID=1727145 RepID=A0A7M3SAH8_9FIRM|nr:hypothetical protein [Anaerocolumna chitinilytica]BCK01596.1 hypothetical protein bsdcttw_46360 [Anaerocolumna chitinilytica]